MRDVSYGVRCSFQRTPKHNKRQEGTIVSSDKPAVATYFLPVVVRRPFAAVTEFAAVAEIARDIRRSLLPSIFPPEQTATRRSSHRSVDRSGQVRRRRGDRDANRSISHEPRCAP